MEEDGRLIRLFPVPFRLISDEKQFKKWQWVSARIAPATGDRREESHRIYVDTIKCDGEPLSTKRKWEDRRKELNKLEVFSDFAALENARRTRGLTLGVLRPSRIVGLDIKPNDRPDWTEEERKKLVYHQQQGGLFDDTDTKSIKTLRKLPFDFYYTYECNVSGEVYQYRHKIVDWEAGALFWNCQRQLDWQEAFRRKLEDELPRSDLMFLMGTIHRFPDQWLIVSLIYPPRAASEHDEQGSLFGS